MRNLSLIGGEGRRAENLVRERSQQSSMVNNLRRQEIKIKKGDRGKGENCQGTGSKNQGNY